jgi:hypothetical protein
LTVEHLSHQAELAVQGIHQHPIAGVPALHIRADLGNFARHVKAEHHRKRHLDARHSLHREYIVVVEGRCANPDDDVALLRPRRRIVFEDVEVFEPAVLLQYKCFHRADYQILSAMSAS